MRTIATTKKLNRPGALFAPLASVPFLTLAKAHLAQICKLGGPARGCPASDMQICPPDRSTSPSRVPEKSSNARSAKVLPACNNLFESCGYKFFRCSCVVLLLVVLSLIACVFPSWAAEPDAVQAAEKAAQPYQPIVQKLESWDAEAAWVDLKPLLAKEPKNVELLQLASETAFFRGDYTEALKLAKSALELGGEDEGRKGFVLLVESTLGVLKSYKQYETAHFVISLDEKQDAILIDYLTDTLEKTYQLIGEQYGFRPKEKIRVELFADTKAFYYTSTLSARDIEVTGAVGLCKFNKLMFLSPKALVHGYRWLDSISHEYMHYMITKLTANNAPYLVSRRTGRA